jgi:8-oxo-dGTP pyrophosphatase MutT (NUDIX family)
MIRVTLPQLRDRLQRRRPARLLEPGPSQAAVAVILVPGSDDLDALFIRRAEFPGDPWSGHMAFPGGRRHADDPGLLDTAVRETHEETGVQLAQAHLLGELDDVAPRTPLLPPIVIRPFVFGLQTHPVITTSLEVAYHRWIPLRSLAEASTNTEILLQGKPTRLPAFVIGQDVVWGLTERIVRCLFDLAA